MTEHALFDHDAAEPLAFQRRETAPPEAFAGARCVRFELTSRGDRVPGRLLLPASETAAPHPLVLLQHGAGGSMESPYLDAAGPWVRGGAAVATIDFPLHGERSNAKFSAVLAAPNHASSETLRIEFARQSIIDLRRTVDALAALPEIDGERIAYGGFSLGAMLGAVFCAVDPRPCAAALALAGGGFGPDAIDPCRFVGAVSPRPILFVNATRDETVPRAATEALYQAAQEPKKIEWFDGSHQQLPGVALKAMWIHLRDALGL